VDPYAVRARIEWGAAYMPDWDNTPDEYASAGVVPWGRSRRLGMLREGRVKAYLGVQHMDPSLAGWESVEEPSTRFFVSLFVDGRVVTLRTFPTMGAALARLGEFLARYQ
jgi:hypothetical protein